MPQWWKLLEILARDAEQLAEHAERQRPREALDDVSLTVGGERVDELAAISSIRGASSATRRGVNAFVISPRILSCTGGSTSMMYGISGKPSASTSRTAGGYAPADDFNAPSDEKDL